MSQVFAAFGIDWKLLLVNLVNFGVLLLALWYFLYGPITRMLEARRKKIAEGVKKAEEAEQTLAHIQESKSAVLASAGKEADQIIAQARESATKKEKEILNSADSAASNILRDAEKQAEQTKAAALTESKQEIAKLIVLGMEKTMNSKQ